jgi:hypothetical protein
MVRCRAKSRLLRGAAVVAAVAAAAAGCGSGQAANQATRPTTSRSGPAVGVSGPTSPAPAIAPTSAAPPALQRSPSPAHPCGVTSTAGTYEHVVWIIMENRALDDVAGSASAPYLAHLAAQCGLATNYAGVAHPSLPNYIALTSGSTHGIGDDGGPDEHPLSGPSIFSLLGTGWRAFDESMPHDCDPNSTGEYAVKHNPAVYYTAERGACAGQDTPLAPTPDLSARYTLITPNLCHDMHDCSTSAGDTWLAHEMALILSSAAYRGGTTAVFITWDENDSGGTLIPLYVVAPSVPAGARSAVAYSHYSLLRTTEELLGLRPLLGAAASATPLQPAFDL